MEATRKHVTRTCEQCGCTWTIAAGSATSRMNRAQRRRYLAMRFCSRACQAASRRKVHRCPQCGRERIVQKSSRAKYCSKRCQGAARANPAAKWNDRDQRNAYYREWHRRFGNTPEQAAKRRAWFEANREKARQIKAKWRQANPDKVRALGLLRRRGAIGTLDLAAWEAMKAECGWRCLACGRAEPEISLTVDHIIPVSRGGTHCIENIQPLCLRCNQSKSSRRIDYRGGLRAEA